MRRAGRCADEGRAPALARLVLFTNVRCVSIAWIPVRRQDRATATSPRRTQETAMRFMVIVKASKESEAGTLPDEKILRDMGKFNEELVKAGVMLAGEGLHPSKDGARVRFEGKKRTVIDGPFAETKELIAGFWLWQCKSKEEAIEWLKRAPFDGGTEVEIRQVFETEEFAASDPTGEIRRNEQQLRARIDSRK